MAVGDGRGSTRESRVSRVSGLMARFLADRRGATAIEYAIIGGGVAVAIAAMVFTIGSTIETTLYGKVAEGMKTGGP